MKKLLGRMATGDSGTKVATNAKKCGTNGRFLCYVSFNEGVAKMDDNQEKFAKALLEMCRGLDVTFKLGDLSSDAIWVSTILRVKMDEVIALLLQIGARIDEIRERT